MNDIQNGKKKQIAKYNETRNRPINIEELKMEIVKKHGYTIDDKDPVLMLVTITEYMLAKHKDLYDDLLIDLSGLLITIKGEVATSIKKQEIALLKKINDNNNANIENFYKGVSVKFAELITASQQLKTHTDKNISSLKISIITSIVISLITLATVVIK